MRTGIGVSGQGNSDLEFSLESLNDIIDFYFKVNEKYLAGEASDEFTVSKLKPDIKTSAPTIEVGKDGKITVTLPKDAKGKVTIEIK